jgi:NAD(P)-dependent dehydrogenase (short-subunit alcohol dehydrogenase family)
LLKLASSNPSIHVLGFAVTEPSQYDKAVAEVKKVVGTAGLNLLINNAGIFDHSLSSLEAHTKQNMLDHYEINVIAPVLLMKAFHPLLKDAAAAGKSAIGSSVVVNITAALGAIPLQHLFPGGYPYKYSKAALNMATYCLADDVKPGGVFVTSLHPGWVRTDLGGPQGELSVEESVSGCINVIKNLTEKHRGKMYDWKNEELPY